MTDKPFYCPCNIKGKGTICIGGKPIYNNAPSPLPKGYFNGVPTCAGWVHNPYAENYPNDPSGYCGMVPGNGGCK